MKLSISIVLYKTVLEKTIRSALASDLTRKLYIIDNSPVSAINELAETDSRVEYIFNPSNPGYGAAHNRAMRKSIQEGFDYHLVLNPDVYFDRETIETLVEYMECNPDVGLVMPKVLHPDGELQYLCKLLPSVADVFGRRFGPRRPRFHKCNNRYELRTTGYDKIMDVPYLSGCFMFFRNAALEKIGLFDERFFMYFEDTDLTRRMHRHYRTVYYPHTHIYHGYQKGSYKSLRLLGIHIVSAVKYFAKWGVFDRERKRINAAVLEKLDSQTQCRMERSKAPLP